MRMPTMRPLMPPNPSFIPEKFFPTILQKRLAS